MAITIQTDVSALARSRFAISPAVELVTVLRGRRGSAHPHLRRWRARALTRLDDRTTPLLHALGVLADCGLVASRRNGRGVVYRRTSLGDALFNGEITVPALD